MDSSVAPPRPPPRRVHMWDHHLEVWQELQFSELVDRFRACVDIRDRKYRLVTYKQTFVGSSAVQALVSGAVARDKQDALRLGQILIDAGVIEHCLREHDFKNDMLYYRFIEDTDRGAVAKKGNRQLSWADYIEMSAAQANDRPGRASHGPLDLRLLPPSAAHVAKCFWPIDEYNIKLLDNVHPPQWIDPEFSGVYSLVVIGAGVGGLITSSAAAGVSAKVALIEANVLGGDCLNVGCVPSKSLIATANLAYKLNNAAKLARCGINIDGKVKIDFPKIMARLRRIRSQISDNDSAVRYTRRLGVDVFFGYAKFASERSVVVNGNLIEFKRAVIATGGHPSIPPIPGLQELYGTQEALALKNVEQQCVLTNDSFFNMTAQPLRMGVIGTGVIAMELAQAMQRLGTQVTMFGREDNVLPKEDRDLARKVMDQLEADGVQFRLYVLDYQGVSLTGSVSPEGYPEVLMRTVERNGNMHYKFDTILVATGRKPNVTGLNLESAGVQYDTKYGLQVNDMLQTTNPRVYGVGDCCSAFKLTHAADAMARIAVRNALFLGREKMSDLLIPYVAFTSPELAHVGLSTLDLFEQGRVFETHEYSFAQNDRAVCTDSTTGLVRIHVDRASGFILGATVLGNDAGNIISEITLAMRSDSRIADIARVVHPYPTTAEIVRQVALAGCEKRAVVAARKFRSSRRQTVR